MAAVCPHCGAHLPPVYDAFCSECGGELEELPGEAPAPNSTLQEAPSPQRPLGITLLAIFLVGNSVYVGVQQFLLLAKVAQAAGPFPANAIPSAYTMILVWMLVLLGVTSGIGMWLGRKGGWWLLVFLGVLVTAWSFWSIALETALVGPESIFTHRKRFTTRSLRIIVSLLLLLYLHRANVLAYFVLEDVRKRKVMLALIAVGFAIPIVNIGISYWFSR